MTTRTPFIAAIAAFVLLLSTSAGSPQAAARGSRVSQEARNRAQRVGHVRLIVELARPDRAARLLTTLPPGSYRSVRRYRHFPFVALDVTPGGLDAIEALGALDDLDKDVVRVMEDRIHKPVLAESVPLIEGDQMWAAGYDGTGTMIAVLDTGVDAAHPFLEGKVAAEACFSTNAAGTSESFCPNAQDEQIGAGAGAPCPLPDCLHGTHVAGIAAGHDASGLK